VLEADIIIHVRDIAHPDSESQRSDVETVLRELGIGEKVDRGLVEAHNKIDLLDPERRLEIQNQASRTTHVVAVSAVTGEGLAELLAHIDKTLSAERQIIDIELPHADGASLAWLYRHGEVLSREDGEGSVKLTVRLDAIDAVKFEKREG